MYLGAVEHGKSAVLTCKCEKQVGAAEDNGLGALCLT
jgi:hypothetical protein